MNQDPYTVLNISRTATTDEVKRAFHKLAHQHHPDKQGGNAEKFKEVSAAYAEINKRIATGVHTTYPKGAEDPVDFGERIYRWKREAAERHSTDAQSWRAKATQSAVESALDDIFAQWDKIAKDI